MSETKDFPPKTPAPASDGEPEAAKGPDGAISYAQSFPDGGAKAWLTVSGASACLFVSFGWVNCVGIFQDYYQENQLSDYTPSEIAWIPALQIFFMIFSGLFIGKIIDDYGPAIPLAVGTFFHVFGLMMVSISKTYYQILLSQAICSAIGASMVFYPAFTCVTTWFLQKRGAAMGLTVCGSSIGGVIFPIMLMHLIPEVGFGWSMRICAFLILALLIWANLTVRSRIPPTKRPFRVMAFVRPLQELPFGLLTAAIYFFYWGMFIPITFIVVEARAGGMSETLSQYLVPILNGASIIGRTVPNALADKVGHFNMMITMSFLTMILILAVWLPATGNAADIAFAVLFGIASGAGIGLTPVLVAHISPIQDIGVRTGSAYAVASIAALTGSPIGGAIISSSRGSFQNTKIFGGVCCGVGVILFIAARVALVGWKPSKI
ncbi:MFS transporter asaE [Colletotrichum spinosum]|uniref:MFS transporter asaE n=1 Tax=Colletotrichum spinosum TaxID=1347390 RepID=A0A4R8QYV0_9PEZI|nr:MFS transporter asaE [Colletotrichum spinosum]